MADTIVHRTAEQFAKALDAQDFDAARALLDESCTYASPGGEIVGAEAIIESYEENARWAHGVLDHIIWLSEVEPQDSEQALINFFDCLEHQGQKHTYRCKQLISVSPQGSIMYIAHQDIPGEDHKLQTFFEMVGIQRGS